jgi:hypothetical protein
MPTSIPCPHCAAKLHIPDGFKAAKAKCPKCGQPVTLAEATLGGAPSPNVMKAPKGQAPQASAPAAKAPAAPTIVTPSPAAARPDAPSRAPAKQAPLMLLAIIGGGSIAAIASIIALAMYLFGNGSSSDNPNQSAATARNRAVPTSPAASVPHAANSPAAQLKPASSAPAATWYAYNDEPFRFRANFPIEPSPYDPTAEIADPKEREMAAAVMKGRQNLKAVHGGRTYYISAAPLQLGGIPAKVYLQRMSGATAAVHRGFQVDRRQEIDLSGSPGMDFTLRGDGKRKLLRVVVANGHVYSLVVEGDNSLAFANADAQRFFGGFTPAGAASGIAPVDAGGNVAASSARPSSDSPSVTAPENELTGETINFRIAFPAPGASRIELLDAITDPRQRKNAANLFPAAKFQQATWSLATRGRTYVITSFCNINERDRGAARESSQRGRFDLLTEYLYGKTGRNNRLKYAPTERHGMEGTDMLVTRETGEKVVIREAQAGKYSFFARVEGSGDLQRDDPAVQAFFQSLHPPPDSPPLPKKGPIYVGAIVRGYHPIRGIELEVSGKLITVKTTPGTAILNPDGVQYGAQVPNLMREVVGKVGNVVDVVMYPSSKKLNPPAVRMLQVRKLGSSAE